MVPVRAANRLFYHFVGDAEFLEISGGEAQGAGRVGGAFGVVEKNGRAAFRGNDGVIGVGEDEKTVADADADGAAAAAFAYDYGDDGDGKVHHVAEIFRDGLGLAALFGADAGIRAGRVDERHDRETEAVRHFHQPHGLAVALGMGHAEVALDVFLGGAAFLLAYQHDLSAAHGCESADHRLVVLEAPVAVQFLEILAG